ncbi:hypothetical protein EV714DRAFT_278235 [Schizophyllum commune]
MPATSPARPTTPATKFATSADFTWPVAAQARKCCQAKDLVTLVVAPFCSRQQERKAAAVRLAPHYSPDKAPFVEEPATPCVVITTSTCKCDAATLREPTTAGGLRADTRVLERRMIPKPLSLGQVRGVIERHYATDEPPEACARP